MKSLYVTERRAIGNARFEEVLASLAGAPGLSVQLRERGSTDRETLEWGKRARGLLGADVAVYVNRRFDVAFGAEAAGVHLPSDGLPLARVRSACPRGVRVGVSTHSGAEARRAIEDGADLVVLGPVFDTPSKSGSGPPLGPEALEALPKRDQHESEVFAIGGIDESRLDALRPVFDRISGIAGIRIFQESADPRAVAETIAAL